MKYLINLSFNYKNNIAHPENITPITIKKEYLCDPKPTEEINVLIHLIKFHFPFFILFLLQTWLKKGLKTKTEWYNYILNSM